MSRLRAADCHYCPTWVSALWLVAGALALLYLGACRRGMPALDLGPKPPVSRGTLTGLVRGPGEGALPGRTVELVNVATGEKHSATTADNGGFTIELPQGRYRVDLQLHDGETVVNRPGIVDLDRSDIDSHVEFVVSATRTAHRPVYRMDNGLGSPIV